LRQQRGREQVQYVRLVRRADERGLATRDDLRVRPLPLQTQRLGDPLRVDADRNRMR